ncbi:MAG: urease accessory protein UreD [Kineosporiaceae bacterium]
MPDPLPAGRMRSLVEIVAAPGPHGTVLPVLRSDVMVAVRRTDVPGVPDPDGTAQVHLVGTAAGPLTGDELTVRITVAAGARLAVRSAAATLALPAREPGLRAAAVRYELRVGAGAHLDLATEPLVVCRGADVATVTDLVLADGATATVLEQVVLGRHGEEGGAWRGRTVADVAGRPALRHTLDSRHLPGRALVSRLELGPLPGLPGEPAVADAPGTAVLLPLAAGGTLATATGADLAAATAALSALATSVDLSGGLARDDARSRHPGSAGVPPSG